MLFGGAAVNLIWAIYYDKKNNKIYCQSSYIIGIILLWLAFASL